MAEEYNQEASEKIRDLEKKLAKIELTREVQGWRQTELMLEDRIALLDITEKKLAICVEALETSTGYFRGMKFTGCCGGSDCGCMGMPVEEEYYILQRLENALKQIEGA